VAPQLEIKKLETKRMMSVESENGLTTVNVNASSLAILQSCARKAEYILHRNLRPKFEAPATLFGSAIHRALQVFYSAPMAERKLNQRMARELTKDFELMALSGEPAPHDHVSYKAGLAFLEAAHPLRALPSEDKRSLANGMWILSHYFKTHDGDSYEIYKDGAGPFVERTLQGKLIDEGDLVINVFGTIDMALVDAGTGQIVIVDHKTTSQVGKDFYNRLKPNHQYSCYVWLANHVLGLSTQRFMVNGIEVKAKPKTDRGSPPQFPRQITSRTDEDLDEFRDAIHFYVKSYLQWMRSGKWPMGHVDACGQWGGCSFLKICSAPNEIKKNIIAAEYEGALNVKTE
jgi:hypothetical protein